MGLHQEMQERDRNAAGKERRLGLVAVRVTASHFRCWTCGRVVKVARTSRAPSCCARYMAVLYNNPRDVVRLDNGLAVIVESNVAALLIGTR